MYREKGMLVSEDMKMSDVILHNYYLLIMLEHFDMSLVVQEKTIKEICQENNINVEVFLAFANLFNGFGYRPINVYSAGDLDTIIKYLRRSHQYYLEEKCPGIYDFIKQLSEVNNTPEIKMLDTFFEEYVQEVTEHLNYENSIVFPYMLELFSKSRETIVTPEPRNYSVTEYKNQHKDIEEKLTDLKNLLIKYMPQQNDRQIRRRLLFSLFEFEYDLHVHSQIEDSILIPLVEELEKQLKKR
ncbi:MAG: hemerythrin domain-containing protein [Ignavibacteria bacterium]|nr:hemerythrin domain-containing protein [Ignavibacteria bacterium]